MFYISFKLTFYARLFPIDNIASNDDKVSPYTIQANNKGST